MNVISQITDNIFVSSLRAAKRLKKLQKLGITAIVNVSEKNPRKKSPKIHYLFKPIKDKAAIPFSTLKEIYAFIEENAQEGKVLIHCHSGLSRGPGILFGKLLMDNPTWTWEQARKHVRKYRMVSPHPKIRDSILAYLESIEGKKRN